jgi:hypothetical protein
MPKDTVPRQAVPLDKWSRAGAGALGLGAAGAGAYAVFATNLEAGPVALVAMGTLFLLIAVAGVLPTRLKIGENEAEWQQEVISDVVTKLATNSEPESRPAVTEALDELSLVSPTLASPAKAALAAEDSLMEKVRTAISNLEDITLEAPGSLGRARSAGVIVGPDGKKLWLTLSARAPRAWELNAASDLLALAKQTDPDFVGLLVVSTPRVPGLQAVRLDDSGVAVVTVPKKDDGKIIGDVIARELDLPGARNIPSDLLGF